MTKVWRHKTIDSHCGLSEKSLQDFFISTTVTSLSLLLDQIYWERLKEKKLSLSSLLSSLSKRHLTSQNQRKKLSMLSSAKHKINHSDFSISSSTLSSLSHSLHKPRTWLKSLWKKYGKKSTLLRFTNIAS